MEDWEEEEALGLRRELVAERRDWLVKARVWWRVGRGDSRRGMRNGLGEVRRLVARRRGGMVVRSVDAMIAGCEAPAPAPPQCAGDIHDSQDAEFGEEGRGCKGFDAEGGRAMKFMNGAKAFTYVLCIFRLPSRQARPTSSHSIHQIGMTFKAWKIY